MIKYHASIQAYPFSLYSPPPPAAPGLLPATKVLEAIVSEQAAPFGLFIAKESG